MSVETITGPKATGETCNIVIETRGEIPYWEGQSYGVVPPVCYPLDPSPTTIMQALTIDSTAIARPHLFLLTSIQSEHCV